MDDQEEINPQGVPAPENAEAASLDTVPPPLAGTEVTAPVTEVIETTEVVAETPANPEMQPSSTTPIFGVADPAPATAETSEAGAGVPPTDQIPPAAPYSAAPMPGAPIPDASTASAPMPEVPMMGVIPPVATTPVSPTPALVCGIISIVLGFSMFFAPIGIILGIVAIIQGGKYIKSGGTNNNGKAGRICGIAGVALSAFTTLMAIILAIAVIFIAANEDSYSGGSISIGNSSSNTSYTSDDEYEEADKAIEEVVTARFAEFASFSPELMANAAEIADESFIEGFRSTSDLYMTMEDCGVQPEDYVKAMMTGFKYEVSYTNAYGTKPGSSGYANIKVTMKDIFDVDDILNDLMDEALEDGSFDGISQSEMKTKIGLLLMQAVSEADSTTSSWSIDVEFNGTEWEIDEDSWDDEIDYYFAFI